MPRPNLIRIAVAAGTFALIAMIAYQVITWNTPFRKFRRAIDIEHSNYSSDEFGDYGHIVIGRIKDTPFTELASILELPSHTTKPFREVEPDALGWQGDSDLKWWVIPNEFDEIYYEFSQGSQCLLARKGERIYLQDLTW